MAKFLSYEETLPLLQRNYFEDFQFKTRADVVMIINSLSDDPYSETPNTDDTAGSESSRIKVRKGKKLSPRELAKLNKAAQLLLLSDDRKAAAISNYVKSNLNKELQGVPNTDEQNCGFHAILQQISNTEYTFNQTTGEVYSAEDLRVQLIYYMATYADKVYPEAKRLHVLPCPYKDWLYKQLDSSQQMDELTLLGLRLMLEVSFYFIHYFLYGIVEDSFPIAEDLVF